MTIAAAVLAALCTLSACGDDTGGVDGTSPSAGAEDGAEGGAEEQTGGAEDVPATPLS
ncbi:hypothetical protein [Jiangella alba]|uniref:hypothetical protein n=1 Tax=Jiangella alba TaxID=561176 RepID=UPI000A5A9BBB|nr:hypothetical protein [Jiangella alba]